MVLRTPGEKKCMKDYRMVRKYDIRMVDGRERLVRPAKTGAGPTAEPLFYVTNDELFDVLHRAHGDIGHGGRNRMVERLRAGYCNVTKEAVMTYLKLCAVCARKTRRSAASATDGGGARADDAWPRTPDEFVGSRALIELIDMQAHEVDGYRFVVNHRDDATKFTHLVPVRSIRPEAVAVGLLDVYAAFGVPAVLESRCGREYVESVIEHVRSAWPADCCLRIEYAECRGPSSSWPGCGATPPVGDALEDWMARNDCHDWPVALKFLQLQVNCCFDPGKTFAESFRTSLNDRSESLLTVEKARSSRLQRSKRSTNMSL